MHILRKSFIYKENHLTKIALINQKNFQITNNPLPPTPPASSVSQGQEQGED